LHFCSANIYAGVLIYVVFLIKFLIAGLDNHPSLLDGMLSYFA